MRLRSRVCATSKRAQAAGQDRPQAVADDRHAEERHGEQQQLVGAHRARRDELREEGAVEQQGLGIGEPDQEAAREDQAGRAGLRPGARESTAGARQAETPSQTR
jgi:hypothetical protein